MEIGKEGCMLVVSEYKIYMEFVRIQEYFKSFDVGNLKIVFTDLECEIPHLTTSKTLMIS